MLIYIILTLIGIFCLYTYWDNKRLSVSRYLIESKKVNKDIKIFHISDFHYASKDMAKKILLKIHEERPDIIACTGDMIDFRNPKLEQNLDFMLNLSRLAKVYYITGNHEARCIFSENEKKKEIISKFFETIKRYGIVHLKDEMKELEIDGQKINIMGLRDVQEHYYQEYLLLDRYKDLLEDKRPFILMLLNDLYREMNEEITTKYLKQIISRMDEESKKSFNILLTHRSELIPTYVKEGKNVVDLTLSGHAHGGQFRFFGLFGLIGASQGIFPKFAAGIRRYNNEMASVISRGIGNSTIKLRIFNPSEVCIITVRKKS